MITTFRKLLDDHRRINAFKQAIEELVDKNKTVAEIGSALGTYSFFAVQAGAKSVYALERDDIFYVGKEIAKRNKLSHKINFIHGNSLDIALPEKVDYIIMEDYAPLFFYRSLDTVISDAQERFLKKGGRFIPNKILIKMAPVQSEPLFNSIHLWHKNKEHLYGINWDYTTQLVFNQPHYAGDHPKTILAAPQLIKKIDLSRDNKFSFNFQTKIKTEQSGIIHGLLGWWDCWFTPNIFFSNSPEQPDNTWGQLYFPFQKPVQVEQSEEIEVQLVATISKHSRQVDYKWYLGSNRLEQEQNTFKANILPLSALLRASKEYIPQLNVKGKRIRDILGSINGKASWDDILADLSPEYARHHRLPQQLSSIIQELSANLVK